MKIAGAIITMVLVPGLFLGLGCGGRTALLTNVVGSTPSTDTSGQAPFCSDQLRKVDLVGRAPLWITQDEGLIYLESSNQGEIRVVEKADLATTAVVIDLSKDPIRPRDAQVGSNFLYMASGHPLLDRRLARWPLHGKAGDVEELPASKLAPWSRLQALRVLDDTMVLFADDEIWQTRPDRPDQFEVVVAAPLTGSNWGPSGGLLVESDFVYWIGLGEGNAPCLMRVNRASGRTERVTAASHVLGSDDQQVYFSRGDWVWRFSKLDEDTQPLFRMEVTRVVAVGTGLYFVSSSGDLYHAATSAELPTEPRLLARGGPFDSDDYDRDMIVADGAHVFWISGSDPGRRASDSEGWALYESCRVPETGRSVDDTPPRGGRPDEGQTWPPKRRTP